ncbi:MAG: glycosyltransferase family 9 protein [Chloroflexi bacterium]|nr:glycosyltransferase family 9 protein [Chloroflexota bacterium]
MRNLAIGAVCSLLGAIFPSEKPIDFTSVKAIAIIKPCCLGDVLMSTPVLKAIREAFPDARVDFVVGSWSKQAVAGNPHLDRVVDCGRVGGGSYSPGEYLALVRRLRQERYDTCFVFERSVFLTLLPWLAGIPRRIGLDSEGRGFPLTIRVPCAGVRHEVELYLDVVRALGLDPRRNRLEFYPSAQDVEKARQLIRASGSGTTETRRHGGEDNVGDGNVAAPPGGARDRSVSEMRKLADTKGGSTTEQNAPKPLDQPHPCPHASLVAIHPGGGVNPGMELIAKRWPARRFAAIADRVIEEYAGNVLIVGAESDAPLADEMEREMVRRPINLAGKITFGELAGVLASCQLFIGNDTGPLHLAVAVGAPVVAIFGPTDARAYGPYSDEARVVQANTSCRPCFEKGAARPCATYDCVMAIKEDQVWQAVQELLEARGIARLNSATEMRP